MSSVSLFEPSSAGDDQITIVASTPIIIALASAIVATHGDVSALMATGLDPHVHEATPG